MIDYPRKVCHRTRIDERPHQPNATPDRTSDSGEKRPWLNRLMMGSSVCIKLIQKQTVSRQIGWERHRMNLDCYTKPIATSNPGCHAALFDDLPCNTVTFAKTVQGLLIHEHIAPAYGVTLSRDQQAQSSLACLRRAMSRRRSNQAAILVGLSSGRRGSSGRDRV